MQTTNWNDALKNFSLAYEIKKKKRPINQADLGVSLNNLGNYSKAIGDHEQALKYYQKALICKNNPYNRAVTLLNLSAIYLMKNEYQSAFDFTIQAREIFEENSSTSLIPIIQCQGIIGSIYFAKNDYDIAKEFYFIAFEMSQKYLFIDDRYRITCIKALANVYQKENLKQQAIDFCGHQWKFYQQYLTENHVNLAYLFMIIAELYDENEEEKIEFLEKALRILHENIYQQYAITADCLMAMGNYYHKQKLNNKAKMYYIRALEIQKKIYPKNHSILEKTQGLINVIEN
jgi:tetratricopeptide (TPR) repeat protein